MYRLRCNRSGFLRHLPYYLSIISILIRRWVFEEEITLIINIYIKSGSIAAVPEILEKDMGLISRYEINGMDFFFFD